MQTRTRLPRDTNEQLVRHAAARSTILRAAMVTTAIGLGLAGTLLVAGCETTEGAGRDIEKLGDNIEDAAQKNK